MSYKSMHEKLRLLGYDEEVDKYFSEKAVDILYLNWLQTNKSHIILIIVNKLLEKASYKPIKTFDEFKMVVSDLKEIDIVEFIEENKSTLSDICDINKDLSYELRDKRKNYSVLFFKSLMKLAGYNVEYFTSTQKINDISKTVSKYKLVKIN